MNEFYNAAKVISFLLSLELISSVTLSQKKGNELLTQHFLLGCSKVVKL